MQFEMTHTQFAEFITSIGRGEGTPVTLIALPSGPTERVAEIGPMSTKQDMLRGEIHEAIRSHLSALREETKRLETLIESGKLPKKELREILSNLKRHVEQAPGSLDFVLRSAEETLEEATATAQNEVNSFINAAAREFGLKSLNELSGTLKARALLSADPEQD